MIILIRHAKVLFNWKKKYTADGFFAAQAAYDQAPIERITDVQIRHIKDVLPKEFKLYTSTLKRIIETAAMIFPDKTPIQLPELSEIPIYPYRNSDKEIALRRWLFWGRVQWFCNNPRQKRTKQTVEYEVADLIALMQNKHAVIVGHAFQMTIMLHILARHYPVQKPLRIRNLDTARCFIYEKDEDYFKGLKIKR